MIMSHHKASQRMSLFTTQRHSQHVSFISHTFTSPYHARNTEFCSITVKSERIIYIHAHLFSSWQIHMFDMIYSSIILIQSMAYTILWYRSYLTANIHNMRQQHTLISHLCCTVSARVTLQSQKHTQDLFAMGTVIASPVCKHKSLNIDTQAINTHQQWNDSKYTTFQNDLFIHFTSKKANYLCGLRRKTNCKQKQ